MQKHVQFKGTKKNTRLRRYPKSPHPKGMTRRRSRRARRARNEKLKSKSPLDPPP